MLANAETRERRQKRLEHFFREAYALTFGLRPGEKRRPSHYEDEGEGGQIVTVMKTSLSKSEFASALGMKPDAVFVKKMFNIVDKDGDGRISFQVGQFHTRLKNYGTVRSDSRNSWTLSCYSREGKPKTN